MGCLRRQKKCWGLRVEKGKNSVTIPNLDSVLRTHCSVLICGLLAAGDNSYYKRIGYEFGQGKGLPRSRLRA